MFRKKDPVLYIGENSKQLKMVYSFVLVCIYHINSLQKVTNLEHSALTHFLKKKSLGFEVVFGK